MECWERGIDLGRPFPWGDAETILTSIEEIAYRRGVGALLADGVRKASAKVGQGTEAWAFHVKGLEMALHDPRGKKGMGLAYATATRGACHLQTVHEDALEAGGPYPELGLDTAMSRKQLEGKAYLVKTTQVALVTGWDISLEELLTAGERIYNLCRMFNVREGITRADDTLPARIGEPLPEGGSAGETVNAEDLERLLEEYYELRGWDKNGIPTPETRARLGLS
jgi:aldehyde:ferredoxin oxidoreductase